METVKIVFDVDTADVKTSTDDLKALNKVTETEVEALKRLEAESNANKVAFQQLNKELKSANNELLNAKKTFGDTSKEALSAQKNVDSLTDKMAELKTTVKPVEESFVSLRTQLKLAKEEAVQAAAKFGEFSKEANVARERAGALADQTSDLNRQVGLLNPEAKAKAFSNLASGVVGAFSVATGALQAFGVKNKEVEEIAMQLQGALNITQGIASLGQLKEAYQDIKVVLGVTVVAQEALTVANTAEAASATVAATATTGFATALAATGIGAIVIAIGALVGAMLVLGNNTEDAEQKQKDFEEALKNTNEQLDYQQQLANSTAASIGKQAQLDALRAKAKGQSEKEIAAITESAYQRQKALLELDRDNQRKAYLDASKNEKLKYEDYEKFLKRYKDSERALGELNANFETQVLNDQINQQNKAQQEREKNAAKRKQDLQEQIKEAEQLLKLQDDLRKQLQANELAKISDPTQRIQQERQFANEEYAIQLERLQNAGATQEQIDLLAANHTALVIKLSQQEKDIQDKNQKERLDSYKSFIDEMNGISSKAETDPIKKIQAENDAIDAKYAKQYSLAKQNNEDTTALDKSYLAAVQAQQEKLTGVIAEEAKKQTDITAQEQADRLSKLREYGNGAADVLQFITDSVVQGDAAAREQELAQLEDQKNKKLISEEEYQKRLKAIKQKQAEDAKRAAIYNATLDLSRAIIAALTIPPPGSVIAANFAAAVAGLNLARIIATPIPKFQKGTLAVPGVDMGRDSVHAMLQPGEAVIPVSTNRAYHPTIKAIYEKKISPSEINSFVMNRTSSGGKQSITASVDTYALGRALGKNKGVQIENAQVVGKVIANELNNYNVRRGW